MDRGTAAGIDALLPAEMARKAELIGADKVRLDAARLLTLAALAGTFIAFGAMLSVIAQAGTAGLVPYGLARLIAGVAFSLGLILVIVGGAELFTGNNLMVMAYMGRRITGAELLRAWGLVYLGNLAGALGLAFAIFLADDHLHGGGAVGQTALAIAAAKTSQPAWQAVLHGVLGNVLVCLAVWLSYSARSTTDRIMAIVPPVCAFVAAGFEHSIANMYLLPQALLVKYGAGEGFWQAVTQSSDAYATLTPGAVVLNIVFVTAGNVLGGALVGLTYRFVYLRN